MPVPILLLLLAAIAAAQAPVRLADRGHDVRYDRDIRPLLSDRCFTCHGTDAAKRQAGLRLDLGEEAVLTLKSGKRAIVPGDPEASEVLRRLRSAHPDFRMPPVTTGKPALSEAEIASIETWIRDGAVYEPHWSFVPPRDLPPPSFGESTWPRNDIDRYILAAQVEAGLRPSRAADPATLCRRVYLDLTGLPPTPEETDEFASDRRPDAWERLIDRLLTTEPYRTRFAERMATPWLDQARYADTNGIHHDSGRSIWPWRDWVLRSFRDNLPFDRFVVEQIAGDLLPNATQEQIVATGFHRNVITSDEGGAIEEEYHFEYAVDRVATTGAVFLGLTLGCARCHDHKFDPVTMDDFYGLVAHFNSLDEPGVYLFSQDPKLAYVPAHTLRDPTSDARLEELGRDRKETLARRDALADDPAEVAALEHFLGEQQAALGIEFAAATVTAATSTDGAVLSIEADGSVLAGGANPDVEDHHLTLRTDGTDLRMVMLETLTDPSLKADRVGRYPTGNGVLTHVAVEAESVADPTQRRTVRFVWGYANVEQDNGDFKFVNVFEDGPDGWAIDDRIPGRRVALMLADEPFGFDGGTILHVKLGYRSPYPKHSLGRVRLSFARVGEHALARLPIATSSWYSVGQFRSKQPRGAYDEAFGPERDLVLDRSLDFGGGKRWTFNGKLREARALDLTPDPGADYVARRLYVPSARRIDLSLGSDDGLRVFANGVEVHGKRVDRGLTPDEDKIGFDVGAGVTTLVFKIVNTGGPGQFFHRALPEASPALDRDLLPLLLPASARDDAMTARAREAWFRRASPQYRAATDRMAALDREIAAVEGARPKTMVMRERKEPRPTFVMTRGQYDHPDATRPVSPSIPRFLGTLPSDAPKNRLGLARWIVSPENPLFCRVTVNRVWELFFGQGIVSTSEDFGLQGAWPSHPELLDHLAVRFRESGFDLQALVRDIVTSATYMQSSRRREDAAAIDSDNRLLAWFPRQRLGAEALRDQALYVSGLLVERFGGESVKPYQPEGLWEEVSMLDANTRKFVLGTGDDLWRRSVYTFWKRAAPPPTMLAFDAPTREFCTIKRLVTNTPLQALALWNDTGFVEAARNLACRELEASAKDERERIARLHRRVFGRDAEVSTIDRIAAALDAFRSRFAAAPDDAKKLVAVGNAPTPESLDVVEVAAWTMIANALLSSDAAITKS